MPYKDPSSPAAKASLRRRRKRWLRKNPEYHKLYQRGEKNRAAKRAWKKRNPDYPRLLWQRTKEKVFKLYGNKCVRCGFSDKRALQLDHVKDDGCKFRRKRKDGTRTSQTAPAWWDAMHTYQPDKYQILCANCNWIKRYELP